MIRMYTDYPVTFTPIEGGPVERWEASISTQFGEITGRGVSKYEALEDCRINASRWTKAVIVGDNPTGR